MRHSRVVSPRNQFVAIGHRAERAEHAGPKCDNSSTFLFGRAHTLEYFKSIILSDERLIPKEDLSAYGTYLSIQPKQLRATFGLIAMWVNRIPDYCKYLNQILGHVSLLLSR